MGKIYGKTQSEPLEMLISGFFKKNNFFLSNNIDIIKICEDLGIRVKNFSTKQDGYDGFILVNDDYKIIGIDDTLDPIDRRFLIAHELGHYITAESKHEKVLLAKKDNLHHGENKSIEEHNTDYLAAAILVPMKQFKNELELLSIDYKNMRNEEDVRARVHQVLLDFFAKRYRVNEQLIIRRIAEVSAYA